MWYYIFCYARLLQVGFPFFDVEVATTFFSRIYLRGRSHANFVGQKKDFTKVFNSQGIALVHQHGHRFIVFDILKIVQPKTTDLSTRLWVISPTNSVVISQNFVLRSIV